MRNSIFALCVLAAAICAPAAATAIDFESTGTAGSFNELDYAIDGFRFNFTMDNIDIGDDGWTGTGPAHSGSFAGLNNYGGSGEMTRDGGGTFSFHSLWVRNWYDASSTRPGTLVGYLDGVEVGSAVGLSSGAWSQVVGNFAEIDTLRINFGDYFLVDDIAVNKLRDPADVPEPASLALLGLGLAGMFLGKKRLRD
jgi:hypothetical protein